MYCPFCNTTVAEDQVFCPVCGTPLRVNSPEKTTSFPDEQATNALAHEISLKESDPVTHQNIVHPQPTLDEEALLLPDVEEQAVPLEYSSPHFETASQNEPVSTWSQTDYIEASPPSPAPEVAPVSFDEGYSEEDMPISRIQPLYREAPPPPPPPPAPVLPKDPYAMRQQAPFPPSGGSGRAAQPNPPPPAQPYRDEATVYPPYPTQLPYRVNLDPWGRPLPPQLQGPRSPYGADFNAAWYDPYYQAAYNPLPYPALPPYGGPPYASPPPYGAASSGWRVPPPPNTIYGPAAYVPVQGRRNGTTWGWVVGVSLGTVIVLTLVCMFFVFCIGMLAVVSNSSANAQSAVITNFYKKVQAQDYTGAYGLMSVNYQAHHSQTAFTNQMKSLDDSYGPVTNVTVKTPPTSTGNPDLLRFSVMITRTKNGNTDTQNFPVILHKDGTTWHLIDNPEASTT